MDKFARYYAWFLVLAAGLPAVMRLAMSRLVATVTFERYRDDPRRRLRYRRLGLGSGLASLAMVPIFFAYRHQLWILVTAALGVLSGVEMLSNTSAESSEAIVRQNFIYGALYLVTAAASYLLLVRR